MLKIQTENLEKQFKKKIKHAIRKEEKENVQKKLKVYSATVKKCNCQVKLKLICYCHRKKRIALIMLLYI